MLIKNKKNNRYFHTSTIACMVPTKFNWVKNNTNSSWETDEFKEQPEFKEEFKEEPEFKTESPESKEEEEEESDIITSPSSSSSSSSSSSRVMRAEQRLLESVSNNPKVQSAIAASLRNIRTTDDVVDPNNNSAESSLNEAALVADDIREAAQNSDFEAMHHLASQGLDENHPAIRPIIQSMDNLITQMEDRDRTD
jgi:hypothetical protein